MLVICSTTWNLLVWAPLVSRMTGLPALHPGQPWLAGPMVRYVEAPPAWRALHTAPSLTKQGPPVWGRGVGGGRCGSCGGGMHCGHYLERCSSPQSSWLPQSFSPSLTADLSVTNTILTPPWRESNGVKCTEIFPPTQQFVLYTSLLFMSRAKDFLRWSFIANVWIRSIYVKDL